METDFHYYCIGVLAQAAGFNIQEALTIAYASQYVNDATESEPINVGGIIFDPIRTAHCGLSAIDWNVQKKVYLPFHFLPSKPICEPGDSYTTEPDSEFAVRLLDEALTEQPGDFQLIRLGIALHTYADTWSHQGFSGRLNDDNDMVGLWRCENGNKQQLREQIIYNCLPKIAHIQAGIFPDRSSAVWEYRKKNMDEAVGRNNTQILLEGAMKICQRMTAGKNNPSAINLWIILKDRIESCFSNEAAKLEDRCAKWVQTFPDCFPFDKARYDKRAWRRVALDANGDYSNIDWEYLLNTDIRNLVFSRKPDFNNSKWVLFHRAALKQRNFVVERLF
ncbi:MAG: hypothetical protein HQK55_05195 [Deltaproteobacteria bacterium]|nr:hypothetical protein [Deltaproteobacteria bacterium]